MVNYKETLVNKLQSLGLPVYAEPTCTKDTKVPCITYMLRDDSAVANGTTKGYSRLYFYVKVWSNRISEIEEWSDKVDTLMREAGFTRISTSEDSFDTLLVKSINYRALAIEKY